MAKPFYSMEEVCQKLGRDAEGVKELVRAGTLREFRDAGKVFFKADDVDKLAGGGGDDVLLEPIDEEMPRIESTSGGTSMIGLAPIDDEPERPRPAAAAPPRPAAPPPAAPAGIGVFSDDEVELDADPMAKTQISAAAGNEQMALEGSGGGSGLLDLTREADDTSLGAELLDEIYPGEEEAQPEPRRSAPVAAAPRAVVEAPAAPLTMPDAPAVMPTGMYAPAGDPAEGLFSGLMVASLLLLALAGSVLASTLQGFFPDYASALTVGTNRFLMLVGGAALLAVLCAAIGWVFGRPSAPRRAA